MLLDFSNIKIQCHLNHSALPPKQNDLDDILDCSVFVFNIPTIEISCYL